MKLRKVELSSFGANPTPATPTAYVGPVINFFVAGDKLDLLDLPYSTVTATATSDTYNAVSGLLRLFSGTAAAGSLVFNASSLGKGSFHIANDGAGHTMLTHS